MKQGYGSTFDSLERELTSPRGQGLVIRRVFEAPLALVWRAWTEPEHFMKWWGPAGFTCPLARMDVRTGGRYHWCMRAPDGKDYFTAGEFREVVPLKRIVYTDSFADESGEIVSPKVCGFAEDFPNDTIVTVTFEETDGRTVMTLRHDGLPQGNLEEMTGGGWRESLDKLALSLRQSGK